MGLGKLPALMRGFVAHGGNPRLPAAIIDNGTRPNQRVVTGTVETLPELAAKAELHGPAIIILGDVVTLHRKLAPEVGVTASAGGYFSNEAAKSARQSLV